MNRIESWLLEARWAPSAANSQPWRVLADDRGDEVAFQLELTSSAITKRDLLDPLGGAAVIALGALAETLEHIAGDDGFRLASTEIIERDHLKAGAVRLIFRKESGSIGATLPTCGLSGQIQRRRTHRESMSCKALDDEHRQIPRNLNLGGIFKIHEFGDNRLAVAKVMARLDRIRCESEELFSTLLDEVRFANENHGATGLPMETLGISFFGRCWLKLCHTFPWLQKLFKFGVHRIFTAESLIRPIKNSSQLYCIVAHSDRFLDWFQMGKLVQRIWLEFTRVGIGMQPLAMSVLAHASCSSSVETLLSPLQKQTVREVEAELSVRFGVDFAKPTIFLRVGYMNQLPPVSPREVISYIHTPGLGEAKDRTVTS